jgi:hypothetical protein
MVFSAWLTAIVTLGTCRCQSNSIARVRWQPGMLRWQATPLSARRPIHTVERAAAQ